jgi:putative peptide zinc metalloprotease protein
MVPWIVVALCCGGGYVLTTNTRALRGAVSDVPKSGASVATVVAMLVLSVTLHELGHALACKRFGVRILEMGFALKFMLLTGWTRPVQPQWQALTRAQRMRTIAAGPLVSFAMAGGCLLLWAFAQTRGHSGQIALIGAVVACVGTTPTLSPTFPGDAYLLLCEAFNCHGVRTRALTHVRAALGLVPGSPALRLPFGTRAAYWTISTAIVLGWVLAWSSAIYACVKLFRGGLRNA